MTLRIQPSSMSNTQTHEPPPIRWATSIFQCKHKHAHSNCQCFCLPGLLGKQSRRRTIVLWPISEPDIGKQEEIPCCIEGHSWLQLHSRKRGRIELGVGGAMIISGPKAFRKNYNTGEEFLYFSTCFSLSPLSLFIHLSGCHSKGLFVFL